MGPTGEPGALRGRPRAGEVPEPEPEPGAGDVQRAEETQSGERSEGDPGQGGAHPGSPGLGSGDPMGGPGWGALDKNLRQGGTRWRRKRGRVKAAAAPGEGTR